MSTIFTTYRQLPGKIFAFFFQINSKICRECLFSWLPWLFNAAFGVINWKFVWHSDCRPELWRFKRNFLADFNWYKSCSSVSTSLFLWLFSSCSSMVALIDFADCIKSKSSYESIFLSFFSERSLENLQQLRAKIFSTYFKYSPHRWIPLRPIYWIVFGDIKFLRVGCPMNVILVRCAIFIREIEIGPAKNVIFTN